jgi:hypothetical protein
MNKVIDLCPNCKDAVELKLNLDDELVQIIEELASQNNTSFEREFVILFQKAMEDMAKNSNNQELLKLLQNNPFHIPD